MRLLLISLAFFNCYFVNLYAQDSLLHHAAKKHLTYFKPSKSDFSGNGWDSLLTKIKYSNYVLIGEDHKTNEIPHFISAIVKNNPFDNFFCEVDPVSIGLIVNKIKNSTDTELQKYYNKFGSSFSFYALKPEFELLKQITKSRTKVVGTEQIFLLSDVLVFDYLKSISKNIEANKIYQRVISSSNSSFFEENMPFYMLSDLFEKQLDSLLKLKLSKKEVIILEQIKISRKIYLEQNHHLRVQLMKNQLVEAIGLMHSKKNLFKYGANHMTKGESLLKIYDLGNLINNIADSRFESTLNIMIVGKNGFQGSPFKNGKPSKINPETGDLAFLKPFFDLVSSQQYHNFDLKPIRKLVESGDIIILDKLLRRTILGFDYLVIIPEVTAAKYIEN